MKRTNAKLIDAGFTVLRPGETRQPVIKKCVQSSGLGDIAWVVMEKFPSKAARDRRLNELLEDPMTICDVLDLDPAPYWDDELQAVVLPALRKRLLPKCLGEMTWEKGMQAAADAGGKMFDMHEAHYLLYWKDEINRILKEHDGDILQGLIWTSLEYSAAVAWVVNFSSGVTVNVVKFVTFYVRALAAL